MLSIKITKSYFEEHKHWYFAPLSKIRVVMSLPLLRIKFPTRSGLIYCLRQHDAHHALVKSDPVL